MKREAPAASRNVGPIGDVLAEWLPPTGLVLEIASGTGEHALAFARRFPALEWQPTDPAPDALESIAAWREEGPANLRPPLRLDVCEEPWPIAHADAVVAINLVHISPWAASLALLAGAATILPPHAPLILYGPWRVPGEPLARSNLAFEAALQARDPRFGIRNVAAFAAAAREAGFSLDRQQAMPANNRMLLLRRAG
ncbi:MULTISPECIES: DUF938 domain-containing protein [Sphingomonas]|uniref:DUF938 domain-containing protein n=1 Tax=Sphingomonas TaxID=13687 RepID=UPI000DF01A2A|nr:MULTISPECIES: DUF938 domain-containing protein [Sphingomonas]